MQNFSCYLIGDDHLLIQCAEILLKKECRILGIISALDAAQKMAESHNIKHYTCLHEATESLLATDFDYLFSIINSTIIPKTLIERARHLAINFHNAPLPRYAGVHALSWAILNNESEHGVTWHVMNEQIDGGDILKQIHFAIDAQETALSLSLKCYAHSLSLFNELIDELKYASITPIPQNISQSSYYSFRQKPPGNGWLSWEQPACDIMRIVHALDLGHYHHNRLATPKIQIGNTMYLVARMHLLDRISEERPGTVVALHPHAWHICTKTQLISLEQVMLLDGTPCTLSNVAAQHQLKKGAHFSSPTPHQHNQFHYFSEQYAPAELYWVQELRTFQPAHLPFQPQNNEQCTHDTLIPISQLAVNNTLISQWPKLPENVEAADVLIATLFIYLYRLGNKEQCSIWLREPHTCELPDELTEFFAPFVPCSLPIDNSYTYEQTIQQIHLMRTSYKKRGPFLRDVYYRYPELAQAEHQYSLALYVGTDEQCASTQSSSSASVLITIASDTNTITWRIKESLMSPEAPLTSVIKNATQHLNYLMHNLKMTLYHPIDTLSLMDESERHRMLNMGIPKPFAYPRDKTIVQVFEAQAQATPNHTAVVYGKKSLTYESLNHQANQLARCLQSHGVMPHTYAAICTTQELHLIIGLLAILKAGAAYIPIDASYPKQHIYSILHDSKPNLLLASHHLSQRIEDDCTELDIPIVLFDELALFMEKQSSINLDHVNILPSSIAHIIYTSGTTGKPKGVMIPHQGVTRLVKNTNYIELKEHDKVAQAASISFDAATFEIWGALLNGAELVAVPHAVLLDPCKFAPFLERKRITVLWLTSALFNQLAAQNVAMFRHLTYLLVGGDVLNKERIMSVIQCEQGAPEYVLNGYGPTESTTFTTTYPITKQDSSHETIPIGTPIANTFVYVLDEQLQPTPVGAIGELYIGGDGLAHGYLNRPELTSQKFIQNPFQTSTVSILYKTGDNVRWLPNGAIDYLGRQDNQIKIRGFRVELEAIQAHLIHHHAISQCAVIAQECTNRTKILVAFIVCTEEVNDEEIRTFLKNELPVYMIPNFFVRLDKLPLTPNGKVNYKKLPAPDITKTSLGNTYCAPVTPIEHTLVDLWSSLLGIARIGVEDNFFDLGGHSLLLTQLLLKAKELYHTDFSLPEFLENPTIRHLNQLINGDTSTRSTTNQNMLYDRFLPKELSISASISRAYTTNNVLLTGASGFLGAHLLHSLYHNSKATIYCLIRAQNEHEAVEKLNATMAKYHFDLHCNERIIPLVGDLASPHLGLSPTHLSQLSESIDVIVHNGAAVNHLYPYEQLRATNVRSTLDLIAFAMQNKVKPIHFISTLSAASHFLDESQCILEDFMKADNAITPPQDGYSQTKWVAEQLLSEAAHRGLWINIYRPGWIVGHSKTGAFNAQSNHLFMLLKGCIQLQVAPDWDFMLDMLPVDTLSNVIVETALQEKQTNSVFNLINPNKISWRQLIHYINQRGYSVSLIDPEQWKQEHIRFIKEDNALYSLYSLYVNNQNDDWMKGLATISRANSYNTNNAFNEAGQIMPPLDKKLLDIYFNYLEKEDFINPSLNH
ncbi:amino acid adenylation domain-containing protein [uncultured Legionella sp.]|uniref:amino acid adenylation domain-containing protein n=1 Tax=uncultured Legionella sp. TaxID=210934 RepID=UPI0026277BCF|nr:amino acid adenylation domain-containing protein [uncultured Legionella sp.]